MHESIARRLPVPPGIACSRKALPGCTEARQESHPTDPAPGFGKLRKIFLKIGIRQVNNAPPAKKGSVLMHFCNPSNKKSPFLALCDAIRILARGLQLSSVSKRGKQRGINWLI
jgi:hypothetical protein